MFCWLCKKDLKGLDYGHYDLERDPWGCSGNLNEDENIWILGYLITMSRIYQIPFYYWNKYLYEILIKQSKQALEEEFDFSSGNDKFMNVIVCALGYGIIALVLTLTYLVIVCPPLVTFIFY